jgi:serine/threonine protein kinase
MTQIEKTVVFSQDDPPSGDTPCLLCGTAMSMLPNGDWKCPACGYLKKCEQKIGPGSIVGGRYRVLSHLGEGGCGDIFLCHPTGNPMERYVLKIRKNGTGSLAEKRRFEREAHLLKQLNENWVIVDLLDYWTENDAAYMVLEYIKGQNLKDYRRANALDEAMVLTIGHELCVALQYAWTHLHLVHRDIKPANVMIDQDGYVRLLDFGLSKSLDEDDTTITLQRTGLGTPGYMSPEQYQQAKDVDFRTDVFSVGATMFFALTGESPFSGENFLETYRDTLENTPPPITRLYPEFCSMECADLICQMMARSPENRPEDYDQILNSITALLNRLS